MSLANSGDNSAADLSVVVRAPVRGWRRGVMFALGAMALWVGLRVIAWPLAVGMEAWWWPTTSAESLSIGTVNAEVEEVGAEGAVLTRQGARAVSLITPPLSLAAGTTPLVRVYVALPELSAGESRLTRVNFLWQTDAVASFHFDWRDIKIGRETQDVEFPVTVAPETLHRVGVQFADVDGPIRVQGIEFPELSAAERLGQLVWQLRQRETLDNSRINFLRGPTWMERGLNALLLGAMAGLIGLYAILNAARRKPMCVRVVAGVVLLGWLAADLRATSNLFRQWRADERTYWDKPWTDQIAAMSGEGVAWAYAQVTAHVPAGATYAVVSDDPFGPAHRLGYYLAPRWTRVEDVRAADYVIAVGSSAARLDAEAETLRVGDSVGVAVEPVAIGGPGLFVVRRVGP